MGQDGVDPANHGTNIRRLLRFIDHKNALLGKRRVGGAEHALLEYSGTISLERTKLPQCSARSFGSRQCFNPFVLATFFPPKTC